MAAGTYNFQLDQGADHSFSITYYENDGITPKDLTNLQFSGQIRLKMSDSKVFADMTFEKDADPTTGKVKVIIPATETTGKRLNSVRHDDYVEGVYDIKVVDSNAPNTDDDKRLLQGTVQISPEVTKE